MFQPLALFRPPSFSRLVDRGRVCCPVTAADSDVDRCVGCPVFGHALQNEKGELVEIVCHPRLAVLQGL